MTWNFDFAVTKISKATADLIMDTVVSIAESAGGKIQVGGGFVKGEDEKEEVNAQKDS